MVNVLHVQEHRLGTEDVLKQATNATMSPTKGLLHRELFASSPPHKTMQPCENILVYEEMRSSDDLPTSARRSQGIAEMMPILSISRKLATWHHAILFRHGEVDKSFGTT